MNLKAIWCLIADHDYETYEVSGATTHNRCRVCGEEMTYHAMREPFIFGGFEMEVAVLAEREACAKVCESRYMGDNNREDMEAKACAKAIRERGVK